MSGRILTCVYCGHEYPQGTPASGDKVLTDHIRECPEHPMRESEAKVVLLRNALSELVGASNKEDLEKMELAVRLLHINEADKSASLNAIHALLATVPEDRCIFQKHTSGSHSVYESERRETNEIINQICGTLPSEYEIK